VLTLLLLGVGVHLLLPQLAELPRAIDVIRGMTWPLLGVAIAAQVMSYVGNGYLLRDLASDPEHSLSLPRSVAIILASGSVGMVAGGVAGVIAAMARWLRAARVNRGDAVIAGILIIQITNLVVMGTSLVGLAYLLAEHELTALQVAGFGFMVATLALTAGFVALARRDPSRLTHAIERVTYPLAKLLRRPVWPERLESQITAALAVWDRRRARGWLRPLLAAGADTGFDMLSLLALFYAAGHPISLGALLVGYGLPLLLGKVAFLPGGVGVVELTMAVLYGGFGVPQDVLVVVVLAYRLLSFWFPALLGFVLVPFLNRMTDAVSSDP
jgi:uncharacterized protein (TIRG00374 family)